MTINSQDITHIARLARLKTNETESEFYAEQLNKILDVIEQMNSIDTENIEPMSHPQDASLRLREDIATSPDQRERFQENAPSTQEGLYLVPRVVE